MTMFKWIPDSKSNPSGGATQDNGSNQIVSDWLWLYWAITAPLTFAILVLWFWWYKRTDKRYKEKQEHELDEEAKME
ncbi:hypothetical protein CC80DRAFT_309628 [Byssothecium circinans]|uniref:Uncharacterized protein n=1 Tax=Byssothecium circinans TaxID=147558 RepID=A0A6A5UF89_9PLEO|nr:hypothetical protein CC80DRAFT_309628 [Byssothecium circinans]